MKKEGERMSKNKLVESSALKVCNIPNVTSSSPVNIPYSRQIVDRSALHDYYTSHNELSYLP